MNNSTIIIFGATGDLAKRKLIPALYTLVAQNKLKNFIVIGAALDNITASDMLNRAKKYIDHLDDKIWQELHKHSYYQHLDFSHESDFISLQNYVVELEKKHNLTRNRLIYLAAPSHYFCSITTNIALSGIAQRLDEQDKIWQRIVYEKPFGHNLASAHEINTCIDDYFNESQIYRIDHYLTKELVSNITLVRFTNAVFEPLWNNLFIDQVQIILSEEVCVEERGLYYDAYGALRDVVQNHMLELVALIGMEAPKKLTGDYIRTERAKVLEKISIEDGLLGQYDTYTKTPQVAADSKTETFAILALNINNPRWAGVPFYLKTGKCLEKKETVIHIKFKQVDCLLIHHCPVPANWLTIKVAPDSTFSLRLNAKKPGLSDELVPIDMEFCHSCIFGLHTPEAYEVLLEEIMRGEQSVSVRFDEIEYSWKIIDTFREQAFPLYTYITGSAGPKEIKKFEQKHGMRWQS